MKNTLKNYDPKNRRYWNIKDLFETTLSYLKEKKIQSPQRVTELLFLKVFGFKNRIDVFKNTVIPVRDYYNKAGVLKVVDAGKSRS
jgi:lantibiotic modifying enzyme